MIREIRHLGEKLALNYLLVVLLHPMSSLEEETFC